MRYPAASCSTTWNSTNNRRMLADLTSPLSAAALGRNTRRTMYPFTFVLLLPIPWNVGFSGEGKMGNSEGISLLAINEGPPESMTPDSRGGSPCGDVSIQALSGQGSTLRYAIPVPVAREDGRLWMVYNSARGSLFGFFQAPSFGHWSRCRKCAIH